VGVKALKSSLFLKQCFSLDTVILFFDNFFSLAYDQINEPMSFRAIILCKNSRFSFEDL
jgi:hypothetical protein